MVDAKGAVHLSFAASFPSPGAELHVAARSNVPLASFLVVGSAYVKGTDRSATAVSSASVPSARSVRPSIVGSVCDNVAHG